MTLYVCKTAQHEAHALIWREKESEREREGERESEKEGERESEKKGERKELISPSFL